MSFSFLFTTSRRVPTVIPITSRIAKCRRFVIATISTSIHYCNNISATKIHGSRYKGSEAHDGREYGVLPQVVNNWLSESRFAQDKKILDLASGPYVSSISRMFNLEMRRFGHSAHPMDHSKIGNDNSRCLRERCFHRMYVADGETRLTVPTTHFSRNRSWYPNIVDQGRPCLVRVDDWVKMNAAISKSRSRDLYATDASGADPGSQHAGRLFTVWCRRCRKRSFKERRDCM